MGFWNVNFKCYVYFYIRKFKIWFENNVFVFINIKKNCKWVLIFFNFGDFCEIILYEFFLRWYCIIEKVCINWFFLFVIFVRFGFDSIKKIWILK